MTRDRVEAARRLAELLSRENAALARLDFRGAVALAPAKEAALRDVTPDPASAADPALLAAGQRLNALVAENRMLLERAIAVQGRVVAIILRAAAPPAVTRQYAATGQRSQARRTSAMALSARA